MNFSCKLTLKSVTRNLKIVSSSRFISCRPYYFYSISSLIVSSWTNNESVISFPDYSIRFVTLLNQ